MKSFWIIFLGSFVMCMFVFMGGMIFQPAESPLIPLVAPNPVKALIYVAIGAVAYSLVSACAVIGLQARARIQSQPDRLQQHRAREKFHRERYLKKHYSPEWRA